MKKYFLISLSLLLLFLSPISRADVDSHPSDESVTKLVQIMMDEEIVSQMYLSIKPNLDAMQKEIISKTGVEIDTELSNILQKNTDDTIAETKAYILGPKYNALMIKAYKTTFTQKEIDALYQFMSSPEGKSYYKKIPTIMQQLMVGFQSDMMPIINKYTNKIQKDVTEHLKKKDAKNKK